MDSDGDARRSAIENLVRSLAPPGHAAAGDGSVDPSLIRIADRILRSSIGSTSRGRRPRARSRVGVGGGTGGVTNGHDDRPDPAVARRIARSLRTAPELDALGRDTGSARSEADVVATTRRVDATYRRLVETERRERGGGRGEITVAPGVLEALSRLVCAQDDGAAAAARSGGTLSYDAAESTPSGGVVDAPPPPARSNREESTADRGGTRAQARAPPQASDPARLDAVRLEEIAVLRECLYALRNVDAEMLRFCRGPSDDPTLRPTTAQRRVHGESDGSPLGDEYEGVRVRPGLMSMNVGVDAEVARGGRRYLGCGAEDAIRMCGEAGWLYGRIRHYIDAVNGRGSAAGVAGRGGAVARALSSALECELTDYHRLLALWESRLPKENAARSRADLVTCLTLRSLLSDLRSPLFRLTTLASLVDGVTPALRGGSLLSALVLSASWHGDSRRSALLHSLASQSSKPWYDMLYRWTTQGTLPSVLDSTGGREFFVREDASVEDGYLWHGRYILVEERVPLGLVDMDLAVEALAVGKGINFIRRCLGDKGWELRLDDDRSAGNDRSSSEESKLIPKERLGYQYSPDTIARAASPLSLDRYTSPLRRTLSLSSASIHEHILSSLFGRHHLLDHLAAMKRFLFLGQGDFVSALMDGLHRELDERGGGTRGYKRRGGAKRQGAGGNTAKREIGYGTWDGGLDGIYAHTLMEPVDTALRTTNARFLPGYIQNRVRVELLPPEGHASKNEKKDDDDSTPVKKGGAKTAERSDEKESSGGKDDGKGDADEEEEWTAWDAFSLTYDVSPPLTSVVHPQALRLYSQTFHHLFRLRRVEYALDNAWRTHSSLRHSLQTLSALYGNDDDVELFGIDEDVKAARRGTRLFLREAAGARQRASHFATNLRGYLMFEVLEGGWEELVRNLNKASTLDAVVAAHDRYVATVASKCLLNDGTVRQESGTRIGVGRQLRRVVSVALRYARFLERSLEDALLLSDAADTQRKAAEHRTKRGQWGHAKTSDGGEDADGTKLYQFLGDRDLLEKAREKADKFDAEVRALLGALDEKLNDAASHTPSQQVRAGAATSPAKSPGQWSGGIGSSFLSPFGAGAATGGQMVPDFYDSLRFLAFRLDFNQYYERTATGAAAATRHTE